MRFRRMEAGDLDGVVAVEASVHPSPWTLGNFRDSLAAGHNAVIGDDDGCLVAYAVTSQVLDEAELLTLGVPVPEQRRGRGAALMNFLIGELQRAGVRRMFLEVRASNEAAHNLYRRCGFAEIGRRRGYYPVAGGREDAIAMALDLQDAR